MTVLGISFRPKYEFSQGYALYSLLFNYMADILTTIIDRVMTDQGDTTAST